MGGPGSGRRAANPDCRGSHTKQFRELTADEKAICREAGTWVRSLVVCEVCGRFVRGRAMGGPYYSDWKLTKHKPLGSADVPAPKREVTEAMVTEAGD